jgi:hypothetical protein
MITVLIFNTRVSGGGELKAGSDCTELKKPRTFGKLSGGLQ